jgi:hypothetical protein
VKQTAHFYWIADSEIDRIHHLALLAVMQQEGSTKA